MGRSMNRGVNLNKNKHLKLSSKEKERGKIQLKLFFCFEKLQHLDKWITQRWKKHLADLSWSVNG